MWWLLACTLVAIETELSGGVSVSWSRRCRRAQVVIAGYLDHVRQAHDPADYPVHDILDPLVRSEATVRQLIAEGSEQAREWSIVTSVQPSDFAAALAEARPRD